MAYQPIENYGIVGNMRTVALVGTTGSIDWYCYPHFDSPSLFGALLDDKKGGRFSISPINEKVIRRQFYWPETNILVTRFLSSDGIAEIEDFLPVKSSSPFTLVSSAISKGEMRSRHVCLIARMQTCFRLRAKKPYRREGG